MPGGHSTLDNYNAQIAGSPSVGESSKKLLVSEQDAGAACALKKGASYRIGTSAKSTCT